MRSADDEPPYERGPHHTPAVSEMLSIRERAPKVLEPNAMNPMSVSIIIPSFNGAERIGTCLAALLKQTQGRDTEILVVIDGSQDHTVEVVGRFPQVRLILQENAGPAAARNSGVRASRGDVLLFTDDDCEPAPGWLDAMLIPFVDPDVVGVKGAYRTWQKALVARFVQAEYEDRYRLMARNRDIDFIDTYSAAYLRSRFLEAGGFDTAFPTACSEDADLSYRMASRGWKMRFAPDAIVYHQHSEFKPSQLATCAARQSGPIAPKRRMAIARRR